MRRAWWKDGLRLSLHIRPDGIAISVLYALACWGTRKFSLDQFYLPAGVRVAALILCPPRLWPYLVLGEYGYFAQMRYPMVNVYGLPWVILGSIFLMPTVMAIFWLQRRLVEAAVGVGLLCVAAAAATVTSICNVMWSHLLWPTTPEIAFHTSVGRMALGDFLGILTIAAIALLWKTRHTELQWTTRQLASSITALVLMALLGVSSILAPAETEATRAGLLLLLALPATALTCMHGWRGAAIGVPVLNIIVHLTTPSTGLPTFFDPGTFATQQSVAVVSIALFALGSSISYHHRRYKAHADQDRSAMEHARASHISSEREHRERAHDLRKIGDGMEVSFGEVVSWLKFHGHHATATHLLHASAAHSRQFREQASMIYPTSLEQVGLYLALQTGGIRQVWEATNRMARPRLIGDPCQLSLGLQLAAYRALTETVTLFLQNEDGQLCVQARCGRFGRQRGIVLTVAFLEPSRCVSPTTADVACERLAGRLTAYGGSLDCRRHRIRIALSETSPAAANRRAAGTGAGPA
ncbi:MASE1 domain-containing protein [Stenotrophomonas sp.]|uniref:MASE1 domain-containing protein n=1 Tax=Stenotrophomonas sp. TaxID=69392 RepID=UPI002FCCB49D